MNHIPDHNEWEPDTTTPLTVHPTQRALSEQQRLLQRAKQLNPKPRNRLEQLRQTQRDSIRPLSKKQAEVADQVVTLDQVTGVLTCTCGAADCWHRQAIRDHALRRIPRNQ